jgi:hypothetical protein
MVAAVANSAADFEVDLNVVPVDSAPAPEGERTHIADMVQGYGGGGLETARRVPLEPRAGLNPIRGCRKWHRP